jgi:hypothetical protein
MPRDDSLTPRDLAEKLDVLRVECEKCGRRGRDRVERLLQQLGRDRLIDRLACRHAGSSPATGTRAGRGARTSLRFSSALPAVLLTAALDAQDSGHVVSGGAG